MTHIMGVRNVNEINPSEMASDFTDWVHGGAFNIVEELRISGKNRFETVDKLKPYITNERIRVVPKGSKGFSTPNVTNYIGFTNYKDAVPVDDRDRRFLPFFSTKQIKAQLEGAEYFKLLHEEVLYADGGAIVADELAKWQVSASFTVERPPEITGDTDKEEMIDLVKSDLRLMMEEYINENWGLLIPKEIQGMLDSGSRGQRLIVTTAQIKRELGALGYRVSRQRRVNGRQVRTWEKIEAGATALNF